MTLSISKTAAAEVLRRVKLFGALSRTPHGIIDMSTPALAALLCLGGFPPVTVILIGLITVFAGYTAVYALNDVVDFHTDREKARMGAFEAPGDDLDAVLVRHPMAQGLLSYPEGMVWAMGWGAVAVIGAYILNPICVLIFVGAASLEVIYCLLLQVSYLRTLVSGVVKSAGAMAAVFAVDPTPPPAFLLALFAWLFLWEIGGQNVPNDWTDLEADRQFGARTVPVRFGPNRSIGIIAGGLTASVLISPLLFFLSPARFPTAIPVLAGAAGVGLLLYPALRLVYQRTADGAMRLFNRASYYPLVLFAITVVGVIIA